jgi:putative membrane protein
VEPERTAAEADVDARFLLANERTLLAWTRTALTLIASGVGLQQLAEDVPARTPLALALVLAGVAAGLAGGRRYSRADRALRRRELPPVGVAPYAMTGAVVVIGLALLVAIAVAG